VTAIASPQTKSTYDRLTVARSAHIQAVVDHRVAHDATWQAFCKFFADPASLPCEVAYFEACKSRELAGVKRTATRDELALAEYAAIDSGLLRRCDAIAARLEESRSSPAVIGGHYSPESHIRPLFTAASA